MAEPTGTGPQRPVQLTAAARYRDLAIENGTVRARMPQEQRHAPAARLPPGLPGQPGDADAAALLPAPCAASRTTGAVPGICGGKITL